MREKVLKYFHFNDLFAKVSVKGERGFECGLKVLAIVTPCLSQHLEDFFRRVSPPFPVSTTAD
jgi:hypothetical protein